MPKTIYHLGLSKGNKAGTVILCALAAVLAGLRLAGGTPGRVNTKMPLILTSDGQDGLYIYAPNASAKIGCWCKAPQIPDRCYTCFDPYTFTAYPATGYTEEADSWRYGTCERCKADKPGR